MNLNWPTHRLKTKKQLLSGFSIFIVQNSDCWNSSTTFPPIFVTLMVSKIQKGTPIRCISLLLSQKELEKCKPPEMKAERERLRTKDCKSIFKANSVGNFCLPNSLSEVKKHVKRKSGLFKDYYRCIEMFFVCGKTYYIYDTTLNNFEVSSKSCIQPVLEHSSDRCLEKYRCIVDNGIEIMSTNTGSRAKHHAVAAYEQS